jgi:hypothetical protein
LEDDDDAGGGDESSRFSGPLKGIKLDVILHTQQSLQRQWQLCSHPFTDERTKALG